MGTKMSIKDTLTKYIDDVIKLVDDESNTQKFLETTGQELHFDYISQYIPKWNPNLVLSPMERSHQFFELSNGISFLELEYSGFTRRSYFPKGVWQEFSDDPEGLKPPDERELEKDYAYYQETGNDPEASPEGGGKYYVHFGTAAYNPMYNMRATELMYNWLRLQRWKGSKVKSLSKLEDKFGLERD